MSYLGPSVNASCLRYFKIISCWPHTAKSTEGCKCLIIKRDCGERGSTTHHFTEYQNIANPRKTWILGFWVICYCVTKYHFSGQIRVQNRVQWFWGHFRTTFH